LKINFTKSKLIPLNISEPYITNFATLFQCKVSSLLLKYLSLPLYWKKPSKLDWKILIQKLQKCLPSWNGKLLSLKGRLILLNSIFSSLPIYYLSFFLISQNILRRIDQIQKRFLWAG
jgi:hypothetical protein